MGLILHFFAIDELYCI